MAQDEPERPTSSTSVSPYSHEEGITLLEVLVVLAKHKRSLILLPVASAVVAGLVSLALPNVYTATAKILPPQQAGSPMASAFLESLSGSGAGTFLGQALGLKNPSELYVGMLRSRTIADSMIHRFDLQNLYGTDTLVDTRKALAEVTNIVGGADGIITIEVDDNIPSRAAEMANAYVGELDKLTQAVAITTAGRQRVFLEKQLLQAKDQLADAEIALRKTQEKTGLINVPEQGKAMIESAAHLRALVASKQVELAALRTSTTEKNPHYIRTQQELAGLRLELSKLEKGNPTDAIALIPSAGTIPETGLEYIRKYRDVQFSQTLFELLARQYEIAKSQEAAESGLVQVLDRATTPDKNSKPRRLVIVLVTMVLMTMFAIVAAFILEAIERAKGDPLLSTRITELSRHLFRWK